jgi:hypothetical protein
MEPVKIPFDGLYNSYEFKISNEGVTVIGCDCEDTVNDNRIVEIYNKIGEYIKFKGLDETTKTV